MEEKNKDFGKKNEFILITFIKKLVFRVCNLYFKCSSNKIKKKGRENGFLV